MAEKKTSPETGKKKQSDNLNKEQREALHDLKNKLTAILGNTELAIMDKDDPVEVEARLQTIMDEAMKATKILSAI